VHEVSGFFVANQKLVPPPSNLGSAWPSAITDVQKGEDVTAVRTFFHLAFPAQDKSELAAVDLHIGLDSYEYCLSRLKGDIVLNDDQARKRMVSSMKNAVLAASKSKSFKRRLPLWSDIFGSEESRQMWIRIITDGKRQSSSA
jgi:hypothetical protein